ncbi:MAG: class I SAM-dependent methyltransferase [Chthoniobacteraceae bacterium]
MTPHLPPQDSQQRFSDRVENYVRYRPGYPLELLDVLREHAGLRADIRVADIGSGTGISSRLLLDAECEVFAVEPNAPMREAAEKLSGGNPRFHSVAAPAEATTLAAESVDLIFSAQAFHWFDRERARVEFSRILRPRGCVVLVWNVRQTGSTDFLRDYEMLLQKFATDYLQVRHENVDDSALGRFFADGRHTKHTLPNAQHFDFKGLHGRLLSSSYAPAEGHPAHEPMLAELRRIFDLHQRDGKVSFLYETEIVIGK